jgi:hypothetical protein
MGENNISMVSTVIIINIKTNHLLRAIIVYLAFIIFARDNTLIKFIHSCIKVNKQ